MPILAVLLTGFLGAITNLSLCLSLLRYELALEVRKQIPPRGEILYLMDYSFFKWGDRVWVTVMDFCIAVVLITAHLSWVAVMLAVILGTAWTWYCHAKLWLPRTDGYDSCYCRTDYVSPLGRIHLGYFWAQWTFGLLGLWEVFQMAPRLLGFSLGRPLDWTSPIALVGLLPAGAYFWVWYSDIKAGRFPTYS